MASNTRLGASRLPQAGTTIFEVMSMLAAEHRAVNLGQGFPDFDGDPQLHALLAEAARAGHNQYAPLAGVAALRRAIVTKQAALYGHAYDADDEITITAGATQAMIATIFALVHPGDEVIVLEPAFDCYAPSILLAGAVPVFVPLVAPRSAADGFAPDWERVRAAITARTRLLLVNFPHNPTGRVLTDADLRALEEIVAATGILLASDEVYEHIIFDGAPHRSVCRSPLLAAHSVVISSFGKTFHATGWKVGYAMAPRAMTAEIRKIHQFMVFAVNTPAQHAFAHYLADAAPWQRLSAFYQAKRDRLIAGLRDTALTPLAAEGTFFLLVDYARASDLPEVEFARDLTIRIGVAAIPVAVFYDRPVEQHLVRLCFAKREETLEAAIERLRRL